LSLKRSLLSLVLLLTSSRGLSKLVSLAVSASLSLLSKRPSVLESLVLLDSLLISR
jgi:hypothetical protein